MTAVWVIKNAFKKGMRVKLNHMHDDFAVPDGTLGTITEVDDMGTIHMKWDNGSSLGLIFDEDDFQIIKW